MIHNWKRTCVWFIYFFVSAGRDKTEYETVWHLQICHLTFKLTTLKIHLCSTIILFFSLCFLVLLFFLYTIDIYSIILYIGSFSSYFFYSYFHHYFIIDIIFIFTWVLLNFDISSVASNNNVLKSYNVL